MSHNCQLHQVPLSAIRTEDKRYCLLYWDDHSNEDLLTSIDEFGILHPPLIRHISDDSYCIVAGRKRIIASQHLAPDKSIFCHVIPTDIKETSVFSLLLEETKTGKPLTMVEQVIFFEKLIQASSMEHALPMLEHFGYKPQQHVLNDLLKLRSLNINVLKAIHNDIIQFKNAKKLLKLSDTDQQLIVEVITDLRLGGSKQRKLIEMCDELVMRHNLPLTKILTDYPVTVIQRQQENLPQQRSALLTWLQKECFPRSSEAENDFKRKVDSLNLPSTMQINHTPSFEDKRITLSLHFPTWESLHTTIQEIKKLMQ